MKAPGIKENFRVVIQPRDLGDFGFVKAGLGLVYGRGPDAQARIEKDWQERCEQIVKDVERHVSDVSSAYVEFDQQPVCSHCGWPWTEESTTYNGGCCDADEAGRPDSEMTS